MEGGRALSVEPFPIDHRPLSIVQTAGASSHKPRQGLASTVTACPAVVCPGWIP